MLLVDVDALVGETSKFDADRALRRRIGKMKVEVCVEVEKT
jgi:hypothetical protein